MSTFSELDGITNQAVDEIITLFACRLPLNCDMAESLHSEIYDKIAPAIWEACLVGVMRR